MIGNYATTAFNNNQNQYIFSAFSNSTITGLAFDPATNEEKFSVYGPSGTTGDCQVCIPISLFPAFEKTVVMLDGAAINNDYQSVSNDYYSIHFSYNNSNHIVVIKLEPTSTSSPNQSPSPTPAVPEFPTLIILPLFAVAILLSIIIIRKRILKN